MILLYYQIAFAVSFLLAGLYVVIWDRRFDVNITAIFMLVPITNLGHVFILPQAFDESIALIHAAKKRKG